MILAEIERWLSSCGLSRSGEERVLVACSGGRDSVVLAHATAELVGARRVVLGHVDHGTRPGSADDARFVVEVASGLGATALVDLVSPNSDAEAELRRVRYAALEDQRARAGAELVMTAHTRDDQAETVMMQLLRSTELAALTGIARRRDRILRPLLDVPRSAIAAYAVAHRLAWREDPTNVEPRYLRNRIRKELMPLIERRYRARFAERLANLVRTESTPPRVLSWDDVQAASPSSSISMVCIPWAGGTLPDGVDGAAFDAEALLRPSIRKFRPGDKIQPYGMKGRTKVAEVLRTAGVPPEVRTQALLVVDEADRVVWVPGVVRSADAPVQAETKRVWIFELRDHTLETGGEGSGQTRENDTRKDQ